MEERNLRKTMTGVVTSDKMDKTVVIAVVQNEMDKTYGKIKKRTYKLKAPVLSATFNIVCCCTI